MKNTIFDIIEHIRVETKRRLPKGEVAMTSELMGYAYCVILLKEIDRLRDRVKVLEVKK